MIPDQRLARQLLEQLTKLHERASEIWDTYQAAGPGKVDRGLFAPVQAASKQLDKLLEEPQLIESLRVWFETDAGDWPAELVRTLTRTRDLSERCACRLEGLCFITGEAGLIARRDLHEAFDRSLEHLAKHARRLQAALDNPDPRDSLDAGK